MANDALSIYRRSNAVKKKCVDTPKMSQYTQFGAVAIAISRVCMTHFIFLHCLHGAHPELINFRSLVLLSFYACGSDHRLYIPYAQMHKCMLS